MSYEEASGLAAAGHIDHRIATALRRARAEAAAAGDAAREAEAAARLGGALAGIAARMDSRKWVPGCGGGASARDSEERATIPGYHGPDGVEKVGALRFRGHRELNDSE